MRVIKPVRSAEFAGRHRKASAPLARWLTITRKALWRQFSDVQATFPGADRITVASGRTVVCFDIAGNDYRLITAIHYDRRKIFVLRFLTHAEYSKDDWKQSL